MTELNNETFENLDNILNTMVYESLRTNILNLFNKKDNQNDNQNDNKKNKKILEQDYNNDYLSLEQRWNELQDKDNWFSINKDPIKQRSEI